MANTAPKDTGPVDKVVSPISSEPAGLEPREIEAGLEVVPWEQLAQHEEQFKLDLDRLGDKEVKNDYWQQQKMTPIPDDPEMAGQDGLQSPAESEEGTTVGSSFKKAGKRLRTRHARAIRIAFVSILFIGLILGISFGGLAMSLNQRQQQQQTSQKDDSDGGENTNHIMIATDKANISGESANSTATASAPPTPQLVPSYVPSSLTSPRRTTD